MSKPKGKPNCPVCGSANTNGYEGVVYDFNFCLEPMQCDDCGAHFNQLWVRGEIDEESVQTKEKYEEEMAERKARWEEYKAANPSPTKPSTQAMASLEEL